MSALPAPPSVAVLVRSTSLSAPEIFVGGVTTAGETKEEGCKEGAKGWKPEDGELDWSEGKLSAEDGKEEVEDADNEFAGVLLFSIFFLVSQVAE